ncbi:PREDICTED: flocculation protein FLO11-like isoform X1 [Polistes canadensis]|uniref:flocculation protein FLO11-like isoform X1 n=1 Tax=Polistes canadensis TaxID=91411 RepID=UPI000718F9FA|nr:PREDICTED: flocculation protein FLO11-like isoform X1 [Polistes canadensis]XP_014603250.1 PREDICTED: flocculation protein FLO11-like isoform X1 [Polistes canadensis]XP_014603251.1 PREDICTED: flocculation protein FLO11-like isoform X1 [Polistes canadensis]XP_014603252.1 PREDICTED: flocculation protein FLO11-like isoform X1 [Polistes canadensis]XP_014603253.1 PREDICTED: flocculation protein FLO11-like isoform X1 [Polistes canadensis]XP_014603255.1 PREDICTED: flocculation protein FLO11-like is
MANLSGRLIKKKGRNGRKKSCFLLIAVPNHVHSSIQLARHLIEKGCLENRGSPGRAGGGAGGEGGGGGGSSRGTGCDSGESQSQPSRGSGGRHGGSEGSSSKDGDLLSHAASALRRLHFKSAGGSRSCRTVPKVVVMGSSTASETTINTSTDSANTMVTMVTTTDGEQPDDSFDLIDVPPEMSPPPVAPTSKDTPSNSSCTQQIVLPSEKLDSNHVEHNSKSTANVQSTASTAQHHGGGTMSPTTDTVDDMGAPPPTPMIGAHQESRFTFISGRTPPLPDLRAAEFFSTPVRGSVDAGHPDPNQISSMLALMATKEKQIDKGALVNVNSNHTSLTKVTQSCEKNCVDTKYNAEQKKPNINVTTNPLDISLVGGQPSCNVQTPTGTTNRGRGRPTAAKMGRTMKKYFVRCTPNQRGSAGGKNRPTQATIVVQQPSLSLDAPAATILLHPDADARRREENMRQLLDVANTLTLQEIHDFEMRYGSPHHSRSQSVKTPGSRSSGRPNYLCLPQQRSRVASMPNTGVEEEYYRLRHFSITGKGVVNRGDSLKSRRSRSNNSVASSNSREILRDSKPVAYSTEHLTASYPGSARNSAAGSLASSRESSASQDPASYRVLMLGAPAVGKSSLVSQFMTSEYLHAYDTSIDDESGEKTVSVLLAGEESELTFIDHSCAEMTPENCISTYEPHAYCVVYSTTDRASAIVAEEVLQTLWRSDHVSARAVILVGNKVDLARSRVISTEEGKSMATSFDCKFIETSVGINHNVDELLVGLLTQIRLKLENPERTRDLFRKRSRKNRSRSPLGSCSENNSPKKYRGSRTSTSLKVRNLLGKVWARDSKSKSCENLHVL